MTAQFPDRDTLYPVARIRASHIELILRAFGGAQMIRPTVCAGRGALSRRTARLADRASCAGSQRLAGDEEVSPRRALCLDPRGAGRTHRLRLDRWPAPQAGRGPHDATHLAAKTVGWAQTYKDRAARLEAEGRMHPRASRQIAAAKAAGRWDETAAVDSLQVPDDLAAALGAYADTSTRSPQAIAGTSCVGCTVPSDRDAHSPDHEIRAQRRAGRKTAATLRAWQFFATRCSQKKKAIWFSPRTLDSLD